MKKGKLSAVLALGLAIVMLAGMLSLPVSAVEGSRAPITSGDATGTITVEGITGTDAGNVTVSAYRLMDVNFDGQAQQPKTPVYTWADEVAGWVRTNYAAYIGAAEPDNSVQPAFSSAAAGDVAAFYDDLAAAIRSGAIKDSDNQNLSPDKTGTVSGGTCSLTGLAMGNYLILIEGGINVYRPSAVNLVPVWQEGETGQQGSWVMSDATVEIKSSAPTIEKMVKEGENYGGAANANTGDTVEFRIEAAVPQYPADAFDKIYNISDTLPAGLTFTDAENAIRVYGVNDTTGENGALLTENVAYGKTVGQEGTTFTLQFVYDQIDEYSEIRVEYSAVLSAQAVPGQGNTNSAKLEYRNDPYVEDGYNTVSDSATVYTYGIEVIKVDGDNNETRLAGAEFKLYGGIDADGNVTGDPIRFVQTTVDGVYRDGVYRKLCAGDDSSTDTLTVNGTEGENKGKLLLNGLDAGTYYLVETKAPDGYNLPGSPVAVTIADDDIDGALNGDPEIASGVISVTVENSDGFSLPTTGGMGTLIFTVTGVVLMGAAVLMFIVVRRKRRA